MSLNPQGIPSIEGGSFWLPKATSTIAEEIDFAWNAAMLNTVVFFILCMGAMFYFMYRYKRKSDTEPTSPIDHSTKIELIWSLIPLVIVFFLFAVGLKGYLHSSVAPAESYEINVTARMYAWQFTYPDGTVSLNKLGVPKGKPVKLILSSEDTVHSLYIPEFRLKQDAVPGSYTTMWFEATEATDTVLECAEYCGVGHSDMLGMVSILEPKDFEDWLSDPDSFVRGGAPGPKPSKVPTAERGQQIYATKSCASCHSLDGSRIIGPTFKGVWGRSEQLESGETITVDENYVRESIFKPQAKIVKSYPATMPSFEGVLKDRDIDSIIAFLKTQK